MNTGNSAKPHAFAPKALEREQVAHLRVERIGDASEVIDPYANVAFLDAPDVRFARTDHLGKTVLRKPLGFPTLFDHFAKRASFLVDIHAYRICARLFAAASYMEPKE